MKYLIYAIIYISIRCIVFIWEFKCEKYTFKEFIIDMESNDQDCDLLY